MHAVTRTDRRHVLTVHGIDDQPVIFIDHLADTKVVLTNLTVTLVVDDTDHIRPLETTFKAAGFALRTDGTPGSRTRNITGSNLNRLPAEVRDIILTTADTLGVQGLREDLDRILRPHQRATLDD